MSGFELIGMVLGVVGAGVSAVSSLAAGQIEQEAANKQADAAAFQGAEEQKAQRSAALQEEAQGRAELAASQRDALERKLEGDLILSSQQANAAASGGGAGADAPTIMKLMSKTAERTAYGVDSTLYAGEQRRERLFASATARRKSGRASYLGGLMGAEGYRLGGQGAVIGSYGDAARAIGSAFK